MAMACLIVVTLTGCSGSKGSAASSDSRTAGNPTKASITPATAVDSCVADVEAALRSTMGGDGAAASASARIWGQQSVRTAAYQAAVKPALADFPTVGVSNAIANVQQQLLAACASATQPPSYLTAAHSECARVYLRELSAVWLGSDQALQKLAAQYGPTSAHFTQFIRLKSQTNSDLGLKGLPQGLADAAPQADALCTSAPSSATPAATSTAPAQPDTSSRATTLPTSAAELPPTFGMSCVQSVEYWSQVLNPTTLPRVLSIYTGSAYGVTAAALTKAAPGAQLKTNPAAVAQTVCPPGY